MMVPSYSGTRCPSRESQWKSEGSRARRADASKSWRNCSGAKPKITRWMPATARVRPASGSADVATIVEPRCPAMMQRPSLAPVLQLICATRERGSKAAVEAGATHAPRKRPWIASSHRRTDQARLSCPGCGAARSGALLRRGPYVCDVNGSRLCGAALHAAPRPGHEAISHNPSGGGPDALAATSRWRMRSR